MAGRVRLSVVGAAGTLPSKCSKCTVDAVVLVEPQHAALARAAINKLRLKVKDVERVKLVLKSAVREHAVGALERRPARRGRVKRADNFVAVD